jgi:hypothetical protein
MFSRQWRGLSYRRRSFHEHFSQAGNSPGNQVHLIAPESRHGAREPDCLKEGFAARPSCVFQLYQVLKVAVHVCTF